MLLKRLPSQGDRRQGPLAETERHDASSSRNTAWPAQLSTSGGTQVAKDPSPWPGSCSLAALRGNNRTTDLVPHKYQGEPKARGSEPRWQAPGKTPRQRRASRWQDSGQGRRHEEPGRPSRVRRHEQKLARVKEPQAVGHCRGGSSTGSRARKEDMTILANLYPKRRNTARR